jgi:hypothetical protein
LHARASRLLQIWHFGTRTHLKLRPAPSPPIPECVCVRVGTCVRNVCVRVRVSMRVCVCVWHACVHTACVLRACCVCACVRMCGHACVRACLRACVCAGMHGSGTKCLNLDTFKTPPNFRSTRSVSYGCSYFCCCCWCYWCCCCYCCYYCCFCYWYWWCDFLSLQRVQFHSRGYLLLWVLPTSQISPFQHLSVTGVRPGSTAVVTSPLTSGS